MSVYSRSILQRGIDVSLLAKVTYGLELVRLLGRGPGGATAAGSPTENSTRNGTADYLLKYYKKRDIEISNDPFQGCYIDNIFSMGRDPIVVDMVQKYMTREFEKHGLIMSEDSKACAKRKLLGVVLEGEQNRISPQRSFTRNCIHRKTKANTSLGI